jgi:riboflavin kinase/FMN adenylyltransferase
MGSMRVIEWEAFLEEGFSRGGAGGDGGGMYAAVTVGIFDGVHRGHQALIGRITRRAPRMTPVVVTFRENHKNRNPAYAGDISSFRQKAALFESRGVAVTVAADLSGAFGRMSGAEFLRLLRERGGMGFLAVGSDFRCGYRLDTDAPAIKKLNAEEGVPTDIVEALAEGGLPVSSSRVRGAIARGELDEAAALLGRRFCLDVSGAEIRAEGAGGGLICRAAALGRVLPPPGRYGVLLRDSGEDPGERAEVTIGEGSIRIPARRRCEFIEF